jgi:ribokinase
LLRSPGSPRITVVGSINLDLVARCGRLPRPGETVTDAELSRVPGGKGANQAVAAARLGAEVRFIGRVGNDEYAGLATRGLEEARVNLSLQVDDQESTGIALVVVDWEGENQIVVVPGVNKRLDPDAIAVGETDALICQLEIEDNAIEAAAGQTDAFFCLNAAPAREVSDAILQRADLIVANSFEIDALGSSPLGALFAVTLGAEGALLMDDGEEVARARPPEVHAVDGTAAGDAFTACLVVSLLGGLDRQEALERACAAGAIAASRPGAQPSLPTAAEVDEILGT